MTPLLLALSLLSPLADDQVEMLFVKVGPNPKVPGQTPGQLRAVVLIHGLGLHMFNKDKITHAGLRKWQQPCSPLVRRLGRDSDVYGLAYGQNVPVEEIAGTSLLVKHIHRLREAGYQQIVLVGHSAGGLIARHLVEDHPDLGVTRVIQVCSPNLGSAWAALKTARSEQQAFLQSLTRSARQKVLDDRSSKRIPDRVEFVCIVGSSRVGGDGIVFSRSQWTADLQSQGVPVYPLRTTHWDAMHNSRTADLIARLVVEPQPRWNASKVVEVRKQLLGK
jgi:pimeloyl-ACP methyl ester carboxylesterase